MHYATINCYSICKPESLTLRTDFSDINFYDFAFFLFFLIIIWTTRTKIHEYVLVYYYLINIRIEKTMKLFFSNLTIANLPLGPFRDMSVLFAGI